MQYGKALANAPKEDLLIHLFRTTTHRIFGESTNNSLWGRQQYVKSGPKQEYKTDRYPLGWNRGGVGVAAGAGGPPKTAMVRYEIKKI